jgi:glycosyltransferase involved in cell wall biosynthesis
MHDPPFISVIITAYNRKEFLPSAINSVANQTLDKSKYEIIVVKNFEDKEIDSLIKQVGAISLQRGNEIIGSYIVAGIERSTGEVLVFLDDDDEFVQDKLKIVSEIFASDPRIGYYHHDILSIDSSGQEISTNFRNRPSAFIEKTGRLYIKNPITETNANKLLRSAAYGYESAIAVRKPVMIPFLQVLKLSIESAPDLFTFYCSLLAPSSGILVVDPLKLTRYRLHSGNISLFKGTKKENSSIDNEIPILKFLSREKRSLESIMKMMAVTDDPKHLKNLKVVKKMIGYELYNRKLDLDMVDPSSNRRRMLSDTMKFFKYSFRSRFLGSQVAILVRSLMWVFLPRTTRKTFVKRFASQGA